MSEIGDCRCGGTANATTNGYYWYVECSRCPAAVDGACRTEREAITAWRHRLRGMPNDMQKQEEG